MEKPEPTQKNKSRRPILAIFFIQASSSTAFAFFFAGLSLYLTQNKLYSKESATAMTGLFLSFNYFLPLLGGMIAGKIISYRKLYCIGSLYCLCGCLLLAAGIDLYLGLAAFLIKSFVSNVCLNMFVTDLYTKDQVTERRVAFIWSYTGMNLGFFAGFFLSGFSLLANSYTHLFIFMAMLIFISVLLAALFLKEPNAPTFKQVIYRPFFVTAFIIPILITSIDLLLRYPILARSFITLLALCLLGLLFAHAFKKATTEEKHNLIKFIFYSLLAIFFWSLYMLTPTALMQLIHDDVNKHLFGITLAPQWLVNIDSVVILTFAPMLAILLKKKKNNTPGLAGVLNFFQLGLLLASFAFFLLYTGMTHKNAATLMPIWPIFCFLIFMTLSEILIGPTGNAIIGDIIPERLHSVMTGVSSLNIGIGGIFASYIASFFILPHVHTNGMVGTDSARLQQVFFIIAATIFSLTVLLFLVRLSIMVRRKKYFLFMKAMPER